MKKTSLSILWGTTVCFSLTAQAQTPEPALARVIYAFTHINDTLQPEKPHKEEMVLYIGQTATRYGTYASERVNQQIVKQMQDPAFDGHLTITGSGRTTHESYYTRPADRVFKQVRNVAGNRYLITEDYPVIDWHLTDQTKTIGGYTAQQATGRFNGRDYTVWFTTDVPFQAGPWKLLGLPGLVLEATDSRHEVQFHYAGFETLTAGEATVTPPANAIPTTSKKLAKLVTAYQKNPQAALNARSNAGGSGGGLSQEPNPLIDPSRIKSINVKKDNAQTSDVINNPLELEP